MITAPLRILIVAVLCVLSLIGLVVRESMARGRGTEVLLAMEAIDPRALLSGHYVVIQLQEVLPDGEPCPASYVFDDWIGPLPREGLPGGWIALRPAGHIYRVALSSAPSREEALQIAPVAVKGEAFCTPAIATPETPAGGAVIRLDLGIDRFHIEQAEAQRIERALRDQTAGQDARVFAIISVGQDGRARLRGLLVDGERLELGWR